MALASAYPLAARAASHRHLPRPFLKWAGGKGQLLGQYEPLFPLSFQRYCEPFLGGGAVFFHLHRYPLLQQRLLAPTARGSLLMDINPELVNVYRVVRDRATELIELLSEHQAQHSSEYYYWMRSRHDLNELERAARLIYLNKTCFNGLYRENSQGHFNVPVGRYVNPTICDSEALHAAAAALKGTDIQPGDFTQVRPWALGPRDFVYFDPPYYPLSATSSFTRYSRDGFSPDDQIRLRDTFADLAELGVQVMLSNSDCEFVRDLYQDFRIHSIAASRSINSKASKRGKITEVLVTSY